MPGCPLPKILSQRLDDGPAECEPGRAMSLVLAVRRPARGAPNSHRPHAREPGAPATACPAPPPIEATAIRAPRSSLLGVALRPVDRVARGAPCRSPPDRNSLAPARLPRFLDLEVTPRASGSTTGHLRACRTPAYHGARESALGLVTHSPRVAQASRCRRGSLAVPSHSRRP